VIDKNPTDDDMKKLWELCSNFIEDEDICCEEAIYQKESAMMNCPDFLEQMANLIGYNEIEG